MKAELNLQIEVNTAKPVKFSKLYKGCYFVFADEFKETELNIDPQGFYYTKLFQKIDSISYYSASFGKVGVDSNFNKKEFYIVSVRIIANQPRPTDAVLGNKHR